MRNQKGEAIKKIFDSLEEAPATPKQLEDKTGLGHSTVMNVLRDSIVAKIGIFKQLDDSKYAVKWYSEEGHETRNSYDLLSKKFLRPPTPEELAGEIERRPDEARDLLFKYVPGYHEPTEQEMSTSVTTLWEMLVCGVLDLPTKKEWFEKGITKVVVKGVDQTTLNFYFKNRASINDAESKNYLSEFPDMMPAIDVDQKGKEVTYNVEWKEDTKKILHMIDSWRKTAEIHIPLSFEGKNGFVGVTQWDALKIAKEMAEIYVPSERVMEDLLGLIGLGHAENDVLMVLKKFCKNALEVDMMDDEMKEKITSELLSVAFVFDGLADRHYANRGDDVQERNNAFEIIEMLNVRNDVVINFAKDFVLERIADSSMPSEMEGPNISRVVQWLARDIEMRDELIEKIKEIVKDHDPDTPVSLCIKLLKLIT